MEHGEGKFYTMPSVDPSATYRKLYYRLPAPEGRFRSCKVDILVPGTLSIPKLSRRRIERIRGIPVLPFCVLLILKIQGWRDHGKSLRLDQQAKHELDVAQRQGQYERASQLRFATIPELERQLPKESERAEEAEGEGALTMLHDRVTSGDISRVVAKATGIPVQSLLKGEREKLVHVRPTQSAPRAVVLTNRRWRTRLGNA